MHTYARTYVRLMYTPNTCSGNNLTGVRLRSSHQRPPCARARVPARAPAHAPRPKGNECKVVRCERTIARSSEWRHRVVLDLHGPWATSPWRLASSGLLHAPGESPGSQGRRQNILAAERVRARSASRMFCLNSPWPFFWPLSAKLT